MFHQILKYFFKDICRISVLFDGEDFAFAPLVVTIFEVSMPKHKIPEFGELDAISRPLVKYFFNSKISLNTVDTVQSYRRIRYDRIEEIEQTISHQISNQTISFERKFHEKLFEKNLWMKPKDFLLGNGASKNISNMSDEKFCAKHS